LDAAGPIVSVDLPSGVDADSGQVPGVAVRAQLTVTFHADKIGLHVSPGREHAGRVVVADIGIPRAIAAAPAGWLLAPDVLASLPTRSPRSDKYAGAAMLIAGAPGMVGAATLCARAAMRAGAGLVVAVMPDALVATLTGGVTEAVVAGVPGTVLAVGALDEIRRQAGRVRSVAIGPGIGRATETGSMVGAVVAELGLPLVIDADALWHLTCEQIAARSSTSVITPHTGEAARLLGVDRAQVDANRLASARELAHRTGAVVLLKGPGTIIASPDGTVAIDSVGGPELATAGSGDVLTGIIVAMLARGLGPLVAACVGAVAHGVAGRLASRGSGTLASDIAEALPEALKR
jgi:ADP-dependent NAD(P)H-hydrate dehydratase / NAD(P)H-hydrate epimerase